MLLTYRCLLSSTSMYMGRPVQSTHRRLRIRKYVQIKECKIYCYSHQHTRFDSIEYCYLLFTILLYTFRAFSLREWLFSYLANAKTGPFLG